MEIDAEGLRALKVENEELKKRNENLRATNQALRGKPGRAELRVLYLYDRAVDVMLARVPGFAPAWQAVLSEVEEELEQADQGLAAFVKRVVSPSRQLRELSAESIRLLNRQGDHS